VSNKQRAYALIGAGIGLVLGLLFYTDDARSLTATIILAVGQAVVVGAGGYYVAREKDKAP